MRGLLVIPKVMVLLLGSYLGLLFVEANRQDVVVHFGQWQSPSTALGFVVLTSVLVGMCAAGILCSVELVALAMRNKRLRQKLQSKSPQPVNKPADKPLRAVSESLDMNPVENNRFTPL